MVLMVSETKVKTEWQNDKRWSDRFLPEIKQILGLHLIGEPPIEEDQERNTDLIVLKMDAVRIGCRVRRHTGVNGQPYFDKYKDQFTIRCSRPSGCKTELAKIIEGWGDYFLYAFSTQDETSLLRWSLCKLNTFRLWFNYYLARHNGTIPGIEKNNGDDSSSLRAFKFSELPDNFIFASNW